MVNIPRKTQQIFASNAGGSGVAEFGSTADGSPVYTVDPDDIQSPAFIEGLAAGVIAGVKRLPVYEEINGVYLVLSQQLAYILQKGLVEWDIGTTYYEFDVVRKTGTYELYGSLIADNTGNALPVQVDDSNWQYLGDLSNQNFAGAPIDNAVTGASYTFLEDDSGNSIRRSNSASAMTDTLPGTSGALPDGWFCYIKNTDASAVDVISVGGGGSITYGATSGSIYLYPGDSWLIISRGTGNYTGIRIGTSSLQAAPINGQYKNLVIATTSTTAIDIDADSVVCQDSGGNTRKIDSVNLTLNSGSSGANGLDTGSMANNTWYYIFAIYNPTSNTVASLISTSSTSPTLPSGYTYSALLGTVRTAAAADFRAFHQKDNRTYFVGISTLAAGGAATYTSISLASVVPPNAKSVAGFGTSLGVNGGYVSGSTGGIGNQLIQANSGVNGIGGAYNDVPLITAQTYYYFAGASSNLSLWASSYTI